MSGVVTELTPRIEPRLKGYCADAGVAWPPKSVTILAFKSERSLELWASDGAAWKQLRSFPITAASGTPGPKLKEGDLQVPEGIYRIAGLNPNSAFHLSMKVDYPNAFDKQMARNDDRTNLGGDIFIHGAASSIGCIAIGNNAIEELFLLGARVGSENTHVIIAPQDFRTDPPTEPSTDSPEWQPELYDQIAEALAPFRNQNE